MVGPCDAAQHCGVLNDVSCVVLCVWPVCEGVCCCRRLVYVYGYGLCCVVYSVLVGVV